MHDKEKEDGVEKLRVSLRDYFAGQVARESAKNFGRLPDTAALLAKICYDIADALIAEKVRREEQESS